MRLHERAGTIPRLHQTDAARQDAAARRGSGAGCDAVGPQQEQTQQRAEAGWRRWVVGVFLVGLVIPWVITLGPVRLSAYRIVLIAAVLPCLAMWLQGGAGRVRLADFAVLLYGLWGAVCIAVNNGIDAAFNAGGILFVETTGPYMLARCLIRNADDFRNMVLLLSWIVACLLPFAVVEMLTGAKPLLDLFGLVMPTIDVTVMDERWGLRRVQGPFEHPILFGVVCGSVLAMTHMVLGYRQTPFRRWSRTGVVGGTAFLSLSSGPLSAMFAQVLLLAWDWLFRHVKARWKILWAAALGMYASISALSNQSVYAFYITHAPLFDSFSAYYRLIEWEYGSATVLNHPVFGVGLNDYEHPEWILPSVDMFWLIHGIMFGFPGAFFIVFAFLGSAAVVGLKRGLDDRTRAYRTGYLVSMTSFFVAGWAVHFWNATYALFLFLVGSGIWIADASSGGRIGNDTVIRKTARQTWGQRQKA
jgi:hypothetical protein